MLTDFGVFVYFLNFPGILRLSTKEQKVQVISQQEIPSVISNLLISTEFVYFLNFPGKFRVESFLDFGEFVYF